jgi:hypothetical protein
MTFFLEKKAFTLKKIPKKMKQPKQRKTKEIRKKTYFVFFGEAC